ncbi:MAG: Clp1/GlmU family protein [Gemmataceae bacterium]
MSEITIQVAPEWHALADRLAGTVSLLIGAPGTGKSCLARFLADELGKRGPTALVHTDMGQASFGVTTCMGLQHVGRELPALLWFIGDTTPVGNLLPTVIGAGRLVDAAVRDGATTVVVDTTGLVDGAAARVLKYHKALAVDASLGVVLEHADELAPLRGALGGICQVERVRPHPAARDRSAAERRRCREESLARHFAAGSFIDVPLDLVLSPDWTRGVNSSGASGTRRARSVSDGSEVPPAFAPGTVCGLLDAEGFCLGLGLIEEVQADRLILFSSLKERDALRSVQLGRCRFRRDGIEIA